MVENEPFQVDEKHREEENELEEGEKGTVKCESGKKKEEGRGFAEGEEGFLLLFCVSLEEEKKGMGKMTRVMRHKSFPRE